MPSKKIAIVTGGNRGIGLEIAKQLMKADLFVVVGARDRAKCERAMEALKPVGANAVAFPLDVNDTHSARRFVEEVDKQHGSPAVLVNNAGIYPEATDATVVDSPTSIWRETFETNLFGAVRMCREVVPLMKKLRYGRIVNMSSGLGQLHQMGEGSPAYRVSKAALNALTRTLAAEVAGAGILVNSMSPGWVRTDMGGENAPRSVEEGADTAVWLATLASNGPTGQFFRDRKPIPW
ncbi:MAG TPA: SDR family oxidoreductase [Usitatibacter sp.]|jgi:NAD(P)-dependent dehydrogenase (short-subunit alcohol dehydrogenase family)|nr:SDR family oxidoreductase [Usitatibacter sp.]